MVDGQDDMISDEYESSKMTNNDHEKNDGDIEKNSVGSKQYSIGMASFALSSASLVDFQGGKSFKW